ncbi:MAG TPA: pyruvate, phosphate dikinase, partial [Candidatus Hydrogenedentes bacterium]|nr:pyruvate, phosphate dikinase [Candidatus Hydrogenedentota bacterium]
MLHVHPDLSSGLPELDQMLRGLLPGDNVVWQVERIEDYLAFVEPFCRHAMRRGRRLTYFRFARHQPLLGDDIDAERCELEPQMGFEAFLDRIHATIERAGRGAFYVFDCLSDLAADWFSDQMLGNFFKLTCPYLYDLETITYFALLRNYHSSHATTPIRNTTQLLLDVYSHQGRIYLRPLKATQRYSPTMH